MYVIFKGYFCSHFFNYGAISNIKPVLEWSDTVLSGKTSKCNILLKQKLRKRCYVHV